MIGSPDNSLVSRKETMITKQRLQELASQGITKTKAAEILKVSRATVIAHSQKHKIEFKRATGTAPKVLVECPKNRGGCGRIRELRVWDAERRKTDFCVKCHIVALGSYKKGIAASPRTKKKK